MLLFVINYCKTRLFVWHLDVENSAKKESESIEYSFLAQSPLVTFIMTSPDMSSAIKHDLVDIPSRITTMNFNYYTRVRVFVR